jgi:hypothetical protein
MAKLKERLAVSKQTMHRVRMERFNVKKLNEVEGKKQYHIQISNRFAALENLDTEVDNNKTWENIRENIKFQQKRVHYYELKQDKPCFDEEMLKIVRSKERRQIAVVTRSK